MTTIDREELFNALSEALYQVSNDCDEGITSKLYPPVWKMKRAQVVINIMIDIAEGKTQLRLSRPNGPWKER